MDGFNIGKILFNLQHPIMLFKRLNSVQRNEPQPFTPVMYNSNVNNLKQSTQNIQQNTQNVVNQNIQQANDKLNNLKQDVQNIINQNTQQNTQNVVNQNIQQTNDKLNNLKQDVQNIINQNVQRTDIKSPVKDISDIGTNINTQKQSVEKSINMAQNIENTTQQIQQLNFQSADKSIFVKNLLGLPQNFGQILLMVQNQNNPLNGGTLGLTNLNQNMIQPSTVLSNLFNEGTVQPTVTQEVMAQVITNVEQRSTKLQQNSNVLFFSGMISMPEISKLILQNSKQAVAALIIAMASASKQGIGSDHIRDTLSIINSCVAMAESDNPAMTLKSLMMLYIPWLPLNDGVGFDMEITSQAGENDLNDSKLTVLIQTKNYGNIKGVFTLTTSNSVDAYIICTDSFPKQSLLDYLNKESQNHAMNTNIDIEDIKPQKEEVNETRETKVNLSATNEMNPYLLLMAHSFIRGTVAIDNDIVGLSV